MSKTSQLLDTYAQELKVTKSIVISGCIDQLSDLDTNEMTETDRERVRSVINVLEILK
jgi:hypothetical protein